MHTLACTGRRIAHARSGTAVCALKRKTALHAASKWEYVHAAAKQKRHVSFPSNYVYEATLTEGAGPVISVALRCKK